MKFNYLCGGPVTAAAFIDLLALHTGITCKDSLGAILTAGLVTGTLRAVSISDGKESVIYISPADMRAKGKHVSRLVRGDMPRRKRLSPRGDVLGEFLSDSYVECADRLDTQEYRANDFVLSVLNELVKGDHYDPIRHRSVFDLVREFSTFGTDPYRLPVHPDKRFRMYTDSGGIASYQGADWDRGVCDFANKKRVTLEQMQYAIAVIDDDYNVNLSNYKEILADPIHFVKNHRDFGISKKPICSLRAAEAIREMVEDGETAYILQQDTTNSGGLLYAWFTGDEKLARLCNALPSPDGKKQDLYFAVALMAIRTGLIPSAMAKLTLFTEPDAHPDSKEYAIWKRRIRSFSKAIIVPMLYGAGAATLVKCILLDDAQMDITIFDKTQSYVAGSLESLSGVDFGCDSELLDWVSNADEDDDTRSFSQLAVLMMDVAEKWNKILFGDKGMRGLTTRLRPTMSKIKACAKKRHAEGKEMEWDNPAHCKCINYTIDAPDPEDVVTVNFEDPELGRLRTRWIQQHRIGKESAANANVIHSVDSSVVIYTVNRAGVLDICVAPIHDSFGTHCCDGLRIKWIVRDVMIHDIPQDFLDQIFIDHDEEPLGWEGLDKEAFAKSEHFLGVASNN